PHALAVYACTDEEERQHAASPECSPYKAVDQGRLGIGCLCGLRWIEGQLREGAALVHRRKPLLVNDFQPPLPLAVLEIQVGHQRPHEGEPDEAISNGVSHFRLLAFRQGEAAAGCSISEAWPGHRTEKDGSTPNFQPPTPTNPLATESCGAVRTRRG